MTINARNPRAARHRGSTTQENFVIKPIIPHSSVDRQSALNTSASKIEELRSHLKNRRLTDSLELVESSGYSEDIALIILASLQGLEVAA